MYKSKILVGLVLLIYILSVLFQYGGESIIANSLKSFILPIITVLYFLTVKSKTLFFSLFLVIYSFSDLMIFVEPYIPSNVDYYLGNSLYILAYTFLFIEVCKSVSIFYILRHYKIHLFILTILNIYIIYVLLVIVNPYILKTNQYYMELTYNIIMLLVLSLTLINYFYRDNVKSLYLFLGALCIVFGEVIWVAYIYISERDLLNILSSALYILSFYFFYRQSELFYEDRKEEEVSMLIN